MGDLLVRLSLAFPRKCEAHTPPDPAGPTFLKYTPNGRKLITAGTNNVIRVYETGDDGEPINIDDCQENNTAIAASVPLAPYRADVRQLR